MVAERYVRFFRSGRNIPREFELPGKEAVVRKHGDRLIIEPVLPRSLLTVLATLKPIDEKFPAIDELPHGPMVL